jgi:hypothetical protein
MAGRAIDLGTVIAERRLRVTGRPELDVRVRIGMPRAFQEARADYFCPYQILGIGSGKVRYAGGVDALQALELAVLILPTELEALRRDHPGLGWEDAPDGDYGFTSTVMSYPPPPTPASAT